MARCKRCGKDTCGNKFVCPSCMDKFTANRLSAFAQVEAELGKLSAENHAEFVKRVKAIERANKRLHVDAASAPSAQSDSGPSIIPAVESDTQPRQ